ncbi:hypothetical protein GDO81_005992 [Engystomops pustulosus]|uniref:Secreted protein n=1 Tax=Engystomops pustulosus TaxID=76066 RepID=A0AAV7CTL8_ENGPU|nr:hypothetical protein GDO81_005992 [Engystomops pustulosus]
MRPQPYRVWSRSCCCSMCSVLLAGPLTEAETHSHCSATSPAKAGTIISGTYSALDRHLTRPASRRKEEGQQCEHRGKENNQSLDSNVAAAV